MKFIKFMPVIICFILLTAHFSRAGILFLAILSLSLPFLLFVKKVWVVRLIQLMLVLGALEWLRVMYVYIELRMQIGEPYLKLVIILSVISLITALSALIFQTKDIKEIYKL